MGPDSTETQQLTTFIDESCETVSLFGQHHVPTFSSTETAATDLKLYLARPIVFLSGPIAGVPGTVISEYALTTASVLAVNPGKVGGASGMRFTMRFRIQTSCSPFTGGIIKMVWIPDGQPTMTATQTDISKAPGVYLDLAESTTAILDVPWLHTFEYMPLNYQQNTPLGLGVFYLFAFTAINNPTGNSTPTCTLYLSLHDVEFVGALPPGLYANVTAMAGGEAVNVTRPISSMLSAASRVSMLVSRVPFISSYAQTVSWFTNYAAGLASAFGFSKPLLTTPTKRVFVTTNALHQNCDGGDNAASFNLTQGNELIALPGFAGSDVDEMAMSYICGRYSAISRFTLNTTDVADTLKYACRLCPDALWFQLGSNGRLARQQTTTVSAAATILPSYLCYLGNAFQCFKGDLVFKFVSNKTNFHAGRLLVAFTPLCSDTNVAGNFYQPVTLNAAEQWHSAIFDLKGGNSFEFCCPYQSPTTYLPVTQSFGDLVVYVMDPLIAASTVSASIQFTVMVKGAPNFEFAIPNTPYLPMVPFVGTPIAQSGAPPCVLPTTSRDRDCATSMGERIASIKQLMLKACGALVCPTGTYTFAPFYLAPVFTLGTTDYGVAGGSNAFCYYFSQMYAFARGSTLVDVVSTTNSTIVNDINVIALPAYNNTTTYNTGFSCNSTQTEPQQLHARMGYQNTTPRAPVGTFANAVATIYPMPSLLRVGVKGSGAVAYMRVGDDAQVGFLYRTPWLGPTINTAGGRAFENLWLLGVTS